MVSISGPSRLKGSRRFPSLWGRNRGDTRGIGINEILTFWRLTDIRTRRRLIAGPFISLVVGFCEYVTIALMALFAASLVGNIQGLLNRLPWIGNLVVDIDYTTLLLFIIAMTCVSIIIKNIIYCSLMRLQGDIVSRVAEGSLRHLFVRQLHLPYRDTLRSTSSEPGAMMVSDVREVIRNALLPGLDLIGSLVVMLFLICLLLTLDPVLTLQVASSLGLIFVVQTKFSGGQSLKDAATARKAVPAFLEQSAQALGALKETQVMHRGLVFRRRIRGLARWFATGIAIERRSTDLPRLWNETGLMLTILGATATLIGLGRSMEEMTTTLAAFAGAGLRLMPLSNRFMTSYSKLRYAAPVVRDVLGQLSAPPPTRRPVAYPAPLQPVFSTALTARALSCGYWPGEPVCAPIDLVLTPGQTMAVVGPSGTGKTTLLDTLVGLLEPLSGQIEIDGRPLATVLGRWQRQIGYVSQNPIVTRTSLRANVAFGLSDDQLDNRRLTAILELVGLSSLVNALPDGPDTIVGEGGAYLSGGQSQRLCLARALAHDPRLLVLDEGTSQLDLASEHEILANLRRKLPGLAILIVSHRPQIQSIADAVLTVALPSRR